MRFKIINHIYLFITVFILLSCDDKGNTKKKNIIKLTGTQILKDNIAISDFSIIDSLLLINNRPGTSNLFDVYNINKNLKHIVSFGKTGEGPGEFENLTWFNNQLFKQDSIWYFYLYEENKTILSLINLSESIFKKEMVTSKTIKISPKTYFDNLFVIDSSLIIGNSNNLDIKMKRLKYYNPIQDTVIKTIDLFPKIKKKNNKISYLQNTYNRLFINLLKLKPDKTKIVSVMPFLDRIDVFNTQKGSKLYTVNNHNINYETILNQKAKKVYYGDVYASDNYFYTLYYKNGIAENELYQGNFTQTMLIKYNWNGDVISQYILDEPSYKFIVNEKNKTLYAISLNEKIVKYDFKEKE